MFKEIGHRDIFGNYRERIHALKRHHKKRLDEIISILGKSEKSAFQIASKMTWDAVYDSWDFSPIVQKSFTIGETIAHLKYLEEKRIITRHMHGQKILFSLN